jgi:trehalose/maltose hydrolase-like predicted phosphorylase
MLEYRVRRLPTARAAARALGRAGARFPWESAARGVDVTPTEAYDRQGRLVAIRTGELEEHIVADVAWAASCYLDWTGDEEFLAEGGRELIGESARYWASRIRSDRKGQGHIYGVIGPDEYHEPVDDNAYTNVMARWNLRRAAELGAGASDEERERWLDLAHSLVDGYDAESGVYEQFAGFSELEPLVIADLAPRRPVAAELLLGRERVEGAQVVKQADVLMLHHLVPEEVEPGSLVPNLRFYEPRTAHGSSLSPGIHAALFARAGLLDDALSALRLASRIDLDDLTGTTAGGLHLATMGSVWQALALGFAGLRPAPDALVLDPRLPEAWTALDLRVHFRGSSVRVRIEPRALALSADPAVEIRLPQAPGNVSVPPSGLRLERRNDHWEVQP